MSKSNHKPFEQHIESSEFNLNPLVDDGTHVPHHVLHPRLEEWLDTIPHPSSHGQWDHDLDDMQKRLRHSLALEVLERGLLDEFSEQLENIDDETLILMMQYPITITMLSQDYFRQNGYPYGWETPDTTEGSTPQKPPNKWLERLQFWIDDLSQRINRLLQYFHARYRR